LNAPAPEPTGADLVNLLGKPGKFARAAPAVFCSELLTTPGLFGKTSAMPNREQLQEFIAWDANHITSGATFRPGPAPQIRLAAAAPELFNHS
jgi:hypothetical protein